MEFDDDAQKIAFEKFMMRYKSEYRDFSEIGEGTYSNSLTSIAFDCYVEGAQSKQAEIDELREQVTGQARTAQNQQAVIYELQSAIEKALERANHAHIGYGMLYAQFDDVIKILKSTKLKR